MKTQLKIYISEHQNKDLRVLQSVCLSFRTHDSAEEMLSPVMLQDKRQKKDPSMEEELLLTHKLLVSGRGGRAERDDFKTFNPKCSVLMTFHCLDWRLQCSVFTFNKKQQIRKSEKSVFSWFLLIDAM